MREVDVCLVLEGTYPYVTGGVSEWVHELIQQHSNLSFHLVSILPPDQKLKPKYDVPKNVHGITHVHLQEMPFGAAELADEETLFEKLEEALLKVQKRGDLADVKRALEILYPHRNQLGQTLLLNSKSAWEMMLRMYRKTIPSASVLDYFWSWRALFGSFYGVMLSEMPKARLYHALCTGYAGLYAARAYLETGKPVILTEHGIYTNERRIEIALADWLADPLYTSLSIEKSAPDMRDFWMGTFHSYSRAGYEAADKIITLYEGNKESQIADGADEGRIMIIPNGVDVDHFAALPQRTEGQAPTVALIGRVVPIKDVKTFIRAVGFAREQIPDLRGLIIGPVDEDAEYFEECRDMVEYLGLGEAITFTGRVKIEDYLPRIDVIALTSLSEAQPLVLLEAGAAGIPAVATNVGACSEILMGRKNEQPECGQGGIITALSSPVDTASAIVQLLQDRAFHDSCSKAIKKRVAQFYDKERLHQVYDALYQSYLKGNR